MTEGRELLVACPAIATEDLLTRFRIRDPNRVPETSDAVDLQHLIAPLAYCDVIVTTDRYALAAARDVKARAPASARALRSLSDLTDGLSGSTP